MVVFSDAGPVVILLLQIMLLSLHFILALIKKHLGNHFQQLGLRKQENGGDVGSLLPERDPVSVVTTLKRRSLSPCQLCT